MIAIIGFLGNYRGLEKKVTLSAGETTQLGYEFALNRGIEITRSECNALCRGDGSQEGWGADGATHSRPSQYPTKMGQTFHEIGMLGDLWNDVYIVL